METLSSSSSNALMILIGVVVLLLVILIVLYNRLIRLRNQVENASGGIDAQLKKRYDLIPNLVAAIKQYTNYEGEALERITRLRTDSQQGDQRIEMDQEVSAALKAVMIQVENYPELKANTNFINLQRTLNEVESQLSASRRAYNASVTDYNNGIETFPGNLMAGMMNLKRQPVFTVPEQERQNVDVNELFNS